MFRMRVALIVAVLAALQGVHACSNFLLNATFGPGCISGRTMDFETDLDHEIGYMPKGSVLPLLPMVEGCLPDRLETQHAFAFMSSARKFFQNISRELGVGPDEVSQAISDGLNDAGLSVTVQWDYDVTGLPNATACKPKNAISAMDLSTYILASFSTVDEVKAALDPARFSVVNFKLSASSMATLKAAGLVSEQGFPFIHFGIHDAAHNNLVIEFTGGTHKLWDNPTGVLTNEPQLAQHYDQLNIYLKERFQVPQLAFQRFINGTNDPVHYNSTFYAPPGDHSSQSRYIRLAMLNNVAGLRGWPTGETWIPMGSGPSKGLWVAAENILNTIVLPPAIDDAGGAGSQNYDYTQVSILRDHANLMYYFRSPASPQWQRIDINATAAAAIKPKTVGVLTTSTAPFKMVPLRYNNEQPWYTDVSNAF